MLHKIILRETTHESTEFISPIFLFKKPDDATRLTLNLKELSQFVKYQHFKIDGFKTVVNIVSWPQYI